jgi:hypothetical protein
MAQENPTEEICKYECIRQSDKKYGCRSLFQLSGDKDDVNYSEKRCPPSMSCFKKKDPNQIITTKEQLEQFAIEFVEFIEYDFESDQIHELFDTFFNDHDLTKEVKK